MRKYSVLSLAFALFACALPLRARTIEVIVEPRLWASREIAASILQWQEDVAQQGYDSILTMQPFGSPEELRAHLADRWTTTGLDAVLLVGDIPSANFEISEKYWEPMWGKWVDGACNMRGLLAFGTDRFYTDLDGDWEDRLRMSSDNYDLGPNNYDYHGGNTAPEITLGRINPGPLVGLHPGRTEAQMVVDYFEKVHRFRTGQDRVPMSSVVTDPSTTADEFRSLLATPWEHLVTTAIGSIQIDRLTWPSDPPGNPTFLWNYELAEVNPQGLFINLATQWTARDCGTTLHWYPQPDGFFAGEVVFGEGNVLLAIASQARASMAQGIDEFYGPLMAGETFGEALRQYLIAAENYPWHVVADVFAKEMIYGMTIIGDPLLQVQKFMPPPGDANVDGAVDLSDLMLVGHNWQQSPRGWAEGDFNCDAVVNLSDLIILANNWGAGQGSVPEPAALAVVAIGFCVVFARYRAKRRCSHFR